MEEDGKANPCGIPFLLADGFEYVWNGCGGPTWATWRNPGAGENGKYEFLGNCTGVGVDQTWKCGDAVLRGMYFCENLNLSLNDEG